MKDIILRGRLQRFRDGLNKGVLKIGFSGGSITTARTPSNWPYYVRGYLLNQYPGLRLSIANAAIGATNSMCGLSLAQQELIDSGCDVVFVEYACNDDEVDRQERMRVREGLIRKLLTAGIDVVIVYVLYQKMYGQLHAGVIPESIADFETIAENYHISSVLMGAAAYAQAEKGIISWNTWLPDGTHPQHIGSYFYAQKVTEFLEAELTRSGENVLPKGTDLPMPVDPGNWQNIQEIPFAQVQTKGAWSVDREVFHPWFSQRLYTWGIHDSLSFVFAGRGLFLVLSYGKQTALLEYSIDDGPWQTYAYARVWWLPEENFVNTVKFADDLPYGQHTFALRMRHGDRDGFTSSECKILKIVAVQ